MSEWKEVSLSELGKTITGKTPSSQYPEDFGDEVPFITPSDSFEKKYISRPERYLSRLGSDRLKDKIISSDSIMVTCIGSAMGKVAKNSLPSVTNQQINSIIVNENFDSDYIYYLFKNNYAVFRNAASGSTAIPILNKTDFDNLRFKVELDLNQQRKMVSILSKIDDKIEINNQINQELETMAKTLYDYWFVQFDFPDQNGKPYKSSGGKMVYHPELKREIPEGWGVESLVDNTLSTVIKPGIDEFTQKTYLATADVVNTSIKGGRLITYDNRETRANMQPSVNSVWFAKMKSSNKHLFLSHSMKELIDSTILSTGFMGLQCKEESFEYLASFISDPDFEIFKDKLSHGATQQAVNVNDLKSILVTIPDDYTLHEFHKKVKSIFLNIGRNTVEDKYLNSLRDWLLPMLMNGQVKVE